MMKQRGVIMSAFLASSLAVCLVLGCKPKVDLDDFMASDEMEVSPEVWLHRTSASVVTITDKEGLLRRSYGGQEGREVKKQIPSSENA